MLAFGLGRLRWTPDTLWRATPREIAAAFAALHGAPAVPTRGRLAELMVAFPD